MLGIIPGREYETPPLVVKVRKLERENEALRRELYDLRRRNQANGHAPSGGYTPDNSTPLGAEGPIHGQDVGVSTGHTSGAFSVFLILVFVVCDQRWLTVTHSPVRRLVYVYYLPSTSTRFRTVDQSFLRGRTTARAAATIHRVPPSITLTGCKAILPRVRPQDRRRPMVRILTR